MSQDPQTIGRYKVLRTLGAGGMGVVYLAEDPLLKRRVAVKLVRGGGLEQDQALARFRREAEVSARLNHPNVITIHDVGEEPALGPFITMEFVEGSNLSDYSRSRTLDSEARLKILIQAMRALQAAHAAGIVHRDIKPANLMVSPRGHVKLMDFGIARADEAGLTVTGAVLGTPSYLAPEQLGGAEPSAATDCYAFSVMAFELFTGEPPFSGSAPSAILYKIAHEPPSMPDTLDRALQQVFLRALAKNPAERYTDLPSFLRALIQASQIDKPARARLLSMLDEDRPAEGNLLETQILGSETKTEILAPARPVVTPGSTWRIAWLLAPVALGGVAFAVWIGYSPSPSIVAPVVAERERPRVSGEEAPPARKLAPEPEQRPQPTVESTPRVETVPQADNAPPPQAVLAKSEIPPRADVDEGRREEVPSAVVEPSPAEVASRVRGELGQRGMTHVEVSIDSRGKLVLANLADAGEATRARRIAGEMTGDRFPIVTSIRKTAVAAKPREKAVADLPVREAPRSARESAEPSWGEIQREGADKVE